MADAGSVSPGCGWSAAQALGVDGLSESEVMRGIASVLKTHPRVAVALRINSGTAKGYNGMPVAFHRLLRGRGVVTDYIGLLRDGRPFAIEAKKPDWKPAKTGTGRYLREQEQDRYIQGTVELGGVGGFCKSVDEAIAIIEQ